MTTTTRDTTINAHNALTVGEYVEQFHTHEQVHETEEWFDMAMNYIKK